MKKLISLFLVLTVLLCTVPASAKYFEYRNMGIDFSVNANWIKVVDDGEIVGFEHRANSNEYFIITYTEDDMFALSSVDDINLLEDIIKDLYSDEKLSDSLSEENNTYVTIKSSYENSKYVTYGGTKYYMYEKVYNASAYGFYTQTFYDYHFMTIKNGRLYEIMYSRDKDDNHFEDVTNVLTSLGYSTGEITININGSKIYPDSSPVIVQGRTLVPIRAVAEKMNYHVEWDGINRIVTLTSKNGSNTLKFGIDSDYAIRNNNTRIPLDVPAVIIGGRTYLPLRAVTEAMDAYVGWNADTKTVNISY